MSIEITRFTAVNNMKQLAQWLTANAVPDYFDSVTLSSNSNNMVCNMGTGYLKISIAPTTSYGVTVWNISYNIKGKGMDADKTFQSSDVSNQYFSHAVKTSNGIMLYANIGSCAMIITKTDKDGVALIFTDKTLWKTYTPNSGSTIYPRMQMISVDNSSDVTQFPTTSQQDHGEMKTSGMVPAPLYIGTTGDACPNCFHLPSNQHLGEECTFQLDGINYYSNGYIALKE